MKDEISPANTHSKRKQLSDLLAKMRFRQSTFAIIGNEREMHNMWVVSSDYYCINAYSIARVQSTFSCR